MVEEKNVTIDVSRAMTVPGWMGDTELEWLAEQASRCKTIVEVGCWMGRSTVAMAENMPKDAKLYAVDHWKGSEELQEELRDKPSDWLWLEFNRNVCGLAVFPYCGESATAAKFFTEEYAVKFDMIFIDASHDYLNVCRDILAWKPLLSPSGILSGHDYRPSYPGVIQAVNELLPSFRLVEPTDRCAIWWWKQ